MPAGLTCGSEGYLLKVEALTWHWRLPQANGGSMTIAERIQTFIDSEVLHHPSRGDPLAQGQLDSLATEQLIEFLEGEFKVRFDDSDFVVENFSSVQRLAALVATKVRAA
jgi:acyl carrier protein